MNTNGTAVESNGQPHQVAEAKPRTDNAYSHMEAKVELAEVQAKLITDLANSAVVVKALELVTAAKGQEFRGQRRRDLINARVVARQTLAGSVLFAATMFIVLVFLFAVIFMLRGDKDTLLPVLSSVIGLVAGAGGGFVFGRASGGVPASGR